MTPTLTSLKPQNVAEGLKRGIVASLGAGVAFAGATGFCGTARPFALAPWNARSRSD
jgi:hypothetical protein